MDGGASLHSYFQVSSEMFDRVQVRALAEGLFRDVQVRALAGPLMDIQRRVPKPHPRCLGCVLRVVVLLEGSPISTEEFWSSVRVTIRSPTLTKAFLSEGPALGRVLVFPNVFHLRMMEATVFLGTFNAAEMFWYPSPDLCLDTILSRSSTDNTFDLIAWF